MIITASWQAVGENGWGEIGEPSCCLLFPSVDVCMFLKLYIAGVPTSCQVRFQQDTQNGHQAGQLFSKGKLKGKAKGKGLGKGKGKDNDGRVDTNDAEDMSTMYPDASIVEHATCNVQLYSM